MTDFSKAFWNTEKDSISLVMPISKVDQERRIVSGWATTDALDKQGDIVTLEASADAFEKFRGNVRESHTPLAVGKVISFKQDKYYDKEKNTFHNGVFVDVYISKGAEDTWYKINEGILSGFSIGGAINKSEDKYDEEMDKTIRVIEEYELSELSLVDNPANPNANVVSVQKFMGAEPVQKNYLENVFWCGSNDTIILSQEDSYSCPQCSKSMSNIGFVESNDIEKSDTVKNLLKSFDSNKSDDVAIDTVAKSVAENNEKEGIEMGILKKKSSEAEDIVKSEDAAEEVAEAVEATEEVEETEAAEEAAEEVAEEAADEVEKSADPEVEETEGAAEDTVEKSTTPAEGNVEDLAKSLDEVKALVASTVGSVAELAGVVKSIAAQLADVKKSVDGVNEEVGVVKGNVAEFGERVEAAEADTAVRKSGDLGGIVQEEKVEKSMWGGRFLSSADLYR